MPIASQLPDRRRFLQTGLAGLTLAATGIPRLSGQTSHRVQRLLVRFQTDPERVVRMLPAPLNVAGEADMWLEYVRVVPKPRTLLHPGPFAAAALRVEVEYDGKRGWFEPLHWTSHEWGRLLAREYLGLAAKDAEIQLETAGDQVHASVRRHAVLLHRLETTITDKGPGTSDQPPRLPTFVYDYRLDADWRRGLLGLGGVGLLQIPPQPADASDGDSGVESVSRHCDPEGTTFEWPTASAADPVIEFPVKQIQSVTFQEVSTGTGVPVTRPSRPVFVSKVRREVFETSSLVRYDRPVSQRRTWKPLGWREKASAWKLSDVETEDYRARRELQLGPFDMIDIRLSGEAGSRPDILPPPCVGSIRHVLRLLAFRVEASDLSPVPYSEAWLLAFCAVGRVRGS